MVKEQQTLDDFDNLKKELELFKKQFYIIRKGTRSIQAKRLTVRRRKREVVFSLYAEAILILERIELGWMKLIKLDDKIMEISKNKKLSEVAKKKKTDAAHFEYYNCLKFLSLDIKSILQWCYIINDVLSENKGHKINVFPEWLLKTRNFMVVHFGDNIKQEIKYRKLMETGSFGKMGVYLALVLFQYSPVGFKKFLKTYKIAQYLPEIGAYHNHHEIVRYIWMNLDKLSKECLDDSKKKLSVFMNELIQYGIFTPSVPSIIRTLLSVLNKDVKALCR